jgi:uncharacterized membrane protein
VHGHWHAAVSIQGLHSFYVVKFFQPEVLATLGIATTDALVKTLQEEVVMQWKADGLAHHWNILGIMPKAVAFNPIVIVEPPACIDVC